MKNRFHFVFRLCIGLFVFTFLSPPGWGQNRIEGEHSIARPPRNIGSVLSDTTNLVLILPTHEGDKAVQARIHAYAKKVFATVKETSVLSDEEALKQDLSPYNLIVYGTPNGNCWLEKYVSRLPFKIGPEEIIADKAYSGPGLRLYATWANPSNDGKGVVIYTALHADDIEEMNLVPHRWTQFTIAQGQKKLKAGFYRWRDGAWEYPDLPDWPFPTLTKAQMEEDIDALTRIVKDVMPTIIANRKVLGVDVFKNLASYRAKIAGIRSTAEFVLLLDRAINSCKGSHFAASLYGARSFQNYLRPYTQGFVGEDAPIIHEMYRDYLQIVNQYHSLDIPVFYHEGQYYTRYGFTSGETTFSRGLKILNVNDQSADAMSKSLLDTLGVFHFDFDRKKFFLPDLFQHLTPADSDGRIHIKFQGKDGKSIAGVFPVDEAVAYQKPKRDTSPLVRFLDKSKILYIRIPMMNPDDIPFYKSGILAEGKKPNLRAVVIDVRGNPGGSDTVWYTILQCLCGREIRFQDRLGIKNTALNRSYIARMEYIGKVFLEEGKPEKIPFLDQEEFLVCSNTGLLKPADESLRFSGPIFVLSQECYSAAAAMVSVAVQIDQIISVGVRNTYPSGSGIGPYYFSLPHSKFCFAIGAAIDLSNCRKAEDVFHSATEVNVNPTLDEWLEYYNASGEIPLEEFLLKFDPFFKKTLEYLQRKPGR
jgi:hypothetical protein